MLIVVLAMCLAALVHRYLSAFAPSNAIVARVWREPPRLRVAADLIALAAALMFGAVVLADWAANGGPGWLKLLVILAIWDAMKFSWVAALTAFTALSSRRSRGPGVQGSSRAS